MQFISVSGKHKRTNGWTKEEQKTLLVHFRCLPKYSEREKKKGGQEKKEKTILEKLCSCISNVWLQPTCSSHVHTQLIVIDVSTKTNQIKPHTHQKYMGHFFVPTRSTARSTVLSHNLGQNFSIYRKIGEKYHEKRIDIEIQISDLKISFVPMQPEYRQVVRSCNILSKESIYKKKNPTKMEEEDKAQKNWQREINAQVIPEYDVQFILNTKSIFYFPLFLFVCVCTFASSRELLNCCEIHLGKSTHTHTHMHTCIENGF